MLGAGCGVPDVSFCQLASAPLCSATAAIAHYLSLFTSSNYHINLLLLLTRFLLIRIALGESGIHQKKYFPANDQSLKKSIDMNVRLLYFVLRLIWFWFNGLLRRFASGNDDSPYSRCGYCGFDSSFRVATFQQ